MYSESGTISSECYGTAMTLAMVSACNLRARAAVFDDNSNGERWQWHSDSCPRLHRIARAMRVQARARVFDGNSECKREQLHSERKRGQSPIKGMQGGMGKRGKSYSEGNRIARARVVECERLRTL